MGIFGALTTAVSGLSAQSYALENISGNIANSQTTAFRRIETSFIDLIPASSPIRDLSGSVTALSRSTNAIQGQIQSTSVSTHMAINGDGYFIVQQPTGTSDNQPVFSGINAYARRGDFTLNAQGYLVNGAGYYLQGRALDRTTGNPSGSATGPVRITSDVIPARVSSVITYRASLPASPSTANADVSVPGSELMAPGLIGQSTIGPADAANFVATSVAGGSVTTFDTLGNEVNVQLRWAKTANASAGPPPVADTWSLYYQSNSATGAEQWTRIGGDFTFSANGQLTSPTSSPTIAGLTVNGVTVGDVTLDIGTNGLTQFARADGTVQVTEIGQNGYAVGRLAAISITENGRIRGSYTNGHSVDLYEIPLVTFNGDEGLRRLDGGAFAETAASGPPALASSARIVASSLEGSNVDISEEFTKLIVTQQAYAANTRIVTTANQMLQETINMIR